MGRLLRDYFLNEVDVDEEDREEPVLPKADEL